jgi:hypothetical protein
MPEGKSRNSDTSLQGFGSRENFVNEFESARPAAD